MGLSVFDQEASFGNQVLRSCALFFTSIAILSVVSGLIFFDFSLVQAAMLQSLKFPLSFLKDLVWTFWVFAWFGSVCFTPILLLSLLAERELRQVRQRFGRIDTARVKAIRGTRAVLSVALVVMFFICGTLLAPQALLERFGPGSQLTELSFNSVAFLESGMQETGEWLFDEESKSFPRSRLIVFVPVSYLSGSEAEAGRHFRGFHSREVLMNVTTQEESLRAVKSGSLLGGSHFILGESDGSLPERGDREACLESCSPNERNLAELFAQSQPFLIGFQRIAGFLPFFRSVLPPASHFVSDDFLKLRSAERQLIQSSETPSSVYIVNLNGELHEASVRNEGNNRAGLAAMDRSVLARRRDVAWDLLRRFVFRFNFAQTVVLPLPEPSGQKVFGRMLLDKLPKEFGTSQDWGFFDFAAQRYVVFGSRSKCHFLGLPGMLMRNLTLGSHAMSDTSKESRPQLSLWCRLGEDTVPSRDAVSVFVFSSEGPSAEWLAHNSIGVVPVSELPTGPEAWIAKKTPARSTLQGHVRTGSVSDSSLPEARLLADERFWAGLPGSFYRVVRSGTERDASQLLAVSDSDLRDEFKGSARGLSAEEVKQLSQDFGLVLGAK